MSCKTELVRGSRADTLQSFITFMDALKLNLRAKDQLHPFLTELVSGYSRFKGSQEWEGRAKIIHWYAASISDDRDTDIHRLITLNALKASDEITEEQSRQVSLSFPCNRTL